MVSLWLLTESSCGRLSVCHATIAAATTPLVAIVLVCTCVMLIGLVVTRRRRRRRKRRLIVEHCPETSAAAAAAAPSDVLEPVYEHIAPLTNIITHNKDKDTICFQENTAYGLINY